MKHSQIVRSFLLPADQDAPKAIEPAMRPLHLPAPGSIARYHSNFACFLVPGFDVGPVTQFCKQFSHLLAVVTFIQTKILWLSFTRCWSLYYDIAKSSFDKLDIVAVSSGYFKTDGQTVPFDQQAAFDPLLTAVSRIPATFFPAPDREELWSWHHRRPAIASPNRFEHRTQLNSVATILRIRHVPPTTGSGRERCLKRLKNGAKTSIDHLFLVDRRWRSWLDGHSF